MSKIKYDQLTGIWNKLGQFNFKDNMEIFDPGEHTHHFYKFFDKSPSGRKRMYIGQIKSETEKYKQGIGIRIYFDGEFEEGFWHQDKQHGNGRCIFRKGGWYQGGFDHDDKHGYGEYTFLNGEQYRGYYANDNRHGEGSFINDDGEISKGRFEDGEMKDEY